MTGPDSENPLQARALLLLPAIGYAVALAMLGQVIMPFISVPDSGVEFGSVRWRFGYAGILFGTLMYILLAYLAATTSAAILRHRGVLRTLGITAAVFALFVVAALAVFNLDFLQLRTVVVPERSYVLYRATLKADVNAALAVLVFAALALTTLRMAGALAREQKTRAEPRAPVLGR